MNAITHNNLKHQIAMLHHRAVNNGVVLSNTNAVRQLNGIHEVVDTLEKNVTIRHIHNYNKFAKLGYDSETWAFDLVHNILLACFDSEQHASDVISKHLDALF